MTRFRLAALSIVVAFVSLSSCEEAAPDLPAEQWAAKSPSSWPQMVLTNQILLVDGQRMDGASAFLVQNERGDVLVVTARHLLGDGGGIKPEVPAGQVDRQIKSWWLYPRTVKGKSIKAAGVVLDGALQGKDFIALRADASKGTPATPLRIRRAALSKGDRVFVIGCPYHDEGCKQHVYPGEVVGRARVGVVVQMQQSEEMAGFSGAPVIDNGGHVIGVLTGALSESGGGGSRVVLTPIGAVDDAIR